MSNNKHSRWSFTGKGYYIALILCAAAIGISSYLYATHQPEAEETSLQQTTADVEVIEPMEPYPEDIPVIAPRPQPQRETVPETLPEPKEPEPLKTQSPVAGQEVMPYSVEALSYNETTRDWRTHDGVDISAQEGTEVCAAAAGKVYTTYEDDNLGTTLVLVHDGGYTTRYASLNDELLVTVGQTVTAGQPLGYVGTTALVENVLGPHVHFSVSYQGKPMDPAEFLQ